MGDSAPEHRPEPRDGPGPGFDIEAYERLRLPDGRGLAFVEFGARAGRPVIYHHGSPSSRVEAALFAEAAGRGGIRLIAFDRPGIGRSDYRPKWTYPTLVEDVAALADHLALRRFGVLGWSGGGPPALACARLMPERVRRIVLVGAVPFGALSRRRVRGGAAPLKRIVGRCAWHFPRAMDWLVWPLGRFARRLPRYFVDAYSARLGAADRRVLNDPANRTMIEADFRESFRQGVRGYAHDLDRLFSRWEFDLAAIKISVPIWQGTDDELVRPDLERALAATMPTAELRLFESAGHYLPVQRADALFRLFHAAPPRETA